MATRAKTKKPTRKGREIKADLSGLRQRAALLPEEFAALFGRRKNWAYSLIWRNKVRVIKPLGEIMIPFSEVDRLTASPVEFDTLQTA